MRFLTFFGILLLLAGVLASPFVLSRLFRVDESINSVNLFLIQGFRLAAAVSGVILLAGGAMLRRFRPGWFERLDRLVTNLFLVLTSTLLALILCEALLRWLDPYGINHFVYSKKYFSEAVFPHPDPEIVYQHRPDYQGRMGPVEVRINARGLRGGEKAYEKPQGVFRVLCLGDSVTFGWGVPLEQTYAERIEAGLNQAGGSRVFEVVNGGVGGYNTTQEAAFLRTEGYKYHPDLVLLFYAMNDATEMLQPYRSLEPSGSAGKPGALWLAGMVPRMVFSRFFPSLFGFYYYVRMPRIDYVKSFLEEGDSYWAECQRAMLDILKTAGSLGAPVVVFMLPAMQSLEENPYPFERIHEAVREFCERQDILFFDLLPDFRGLPNEKVRVSFFDGHPNAVAHGIVAQSVLGKLKKLTGVRPGP